jgi:hypothetical protein
MSCGQLPTDDVGGTELRFIVAGKPGHLQGMILLGFSYVWSNCSAGTARVFTSTGEPTGSSLRGYS